jgi:protein Tex
VLKLEDLSPGMHLKGTVRNVVDFGAFVDIGLKNDGLVHISRMSEKYVKNPMDVVTVGDIVDVWVAEVDIERERVGLSMVPLS